MNTSIVTFDQPLWLKSVDIANSNNIVNILGVFHLMMNFLGSAWEVMTGSGLGTIYWQNTVHHITSVKAIARAIRAHL